MNSWNRIVRYVVGAALLVCAVGTTGHPATERPAANVVVPIFHASPELKTPFLLPPGCADCHECDFTTLKHVAPPNDIGVYANPHDWCMDLPGCGGHPSCQVTLRDNSRLQEFEPLIEKIETGDTHAVVALVAAFGDMIEYNADRRALQIEGCNDRTIAVHLPLTEEQAAALDD